MSNLSFLPSSLLLSIAKKKHHFRVMFRFISLLTLIMGTFFFNRSYSSQHIVSMMTTTVYHPQNPYIPPNDTFSRSLYIRAHNNTINTNQSTENDIQEECHSNSKLENKVYLILYVAGVIYMFFAIAIVCDEFFVPSLEEIASERYLNLSMDVAGATLMAAGGSAPELFTALIGTFQESEVGFGTIVGSAVFNVLFVIGMCAIFSKEVLKLTCWPLARDCFYYTFSLILLAYFCGYSSPGKIELWEAIVQFSLYFGYVFVMKFNQRIHDWFRMNVLKSKISDTDLNQRKLSISPPSRFRAGLLNLLVGNGSLLDKCGMSMVSNMAGDAETVFSEFDNNSDGYVDKNEFHRLLESLGCKVSETEISSAFSQLDDNHDEKIDLKEFTKWFLKSESRLLKELKKIFDQFDVDKSGTIDEKELSQFLLVLGVDPSTVDLNAVFDETCGVDGQQRQISYAHFEQWFRASPHWSERKEQADACADEAINPISDNLKPPRGGNLLDYFRWIFLFPIVFVLCLTVPDVRQPGRHKLCLISFLFSICWIGGFTYFMVTWAEVIGNTLDIPMVLMGLTFLAAGTSVPDLISSVIVARMGEGDMAVSSSIGSNIFDITVGLPLPWLIYCLWRTSPDYIDIGTKGMEISIIILIVMLMCIIALIHFYGWKMTKRLGICMFVLYLLYLVQAVVRELPFQHC